MIKIAPIGYALQAAGGVEIETPEPVEIPTEWSFSSLSAGNYIFGTAPLSGMPASFSEAPQIIDQLENDSRYKITNRSATGFSIVALDEGLAPQVGVVIFATL